MSLIKHVLDKRVSDNHVFGENVSDKHGLYKHVLHVDKLVLAEYVLNKHVFD